MWRKKKIEAAKNEMKPPTSRVISFSTSSKLLRSAHFADDRFNLSFKRSNMGRQPKPRKPDQFGKGKVTPVQIAYIVDQYLSENHFTQTRSSFRSEASSLISKTPVQEGPKRLMSLDTIIDEYVTMKEQKMVVEMEKLKLEQESLRVQTLLQGMQNVMNAYNASGPLVATAAAAAAGGVPALASAAVLENAFPADLTPNSRQPWVVSNLSKCTTSFTTPMITNSSKKRQGLNVMPGAPVNSKKSRSRMSNKQSLEGSTQVGFQQQSTFQSSIRDCVANLTSVQGSSIAKVLFHKTTRSKSTAQNSSSPTTPPRVPIAQNDKNVSPACLSSSTNSNKTTPPNFSSNCTVVSTKTIIVSPCKKETYYSVEKHCNSTCSPVKSDLGKVIKRDHVKGRLNFDGTDEPRNLEKSAVDESSTSESEDLNIFDLDMPNLDFNISDLLLDFDMQCEELNDAPHQSGLNPSSVETASNGYATLPETSSTQVFSNAIDSYTAMKTVSKCIKIPSPAKHSSPIQEN